jgi:hypothetical protein
VNTENGKSMVEAKAGTTTKEEFGAVTSSALAETASSAVAAQATAAVQARYVMALKKPRDWDDVRVSLLKECKRPRFAEVARYLKPVGRGVTGPSIRFAEAALRCMTNVLPETATIFDNREKRILRQSVTDLESNVTYSLDITIEKTVERSSLRDGQTPMAVRTNSFGKKVFIVEATEDDLLNKQNALVSKALRQNALRLLPGDILDECMDAIVDTQEKQDKADPDAARKKLVDAFVSMGVKPSDLKLYLGHELASASPAEIGELRAVYAAIRDGEGNWKDALAIKQKGAADGSDTKPKTTKEKVAEAKAKANGAPAAQTEAAPSKPAASEPAIEIDPETGEVVPPAREETA